MEREDWIQTSSHCCSSQPECSDTICVFQFDTIQQAKSVLSQVAYALAVAEEMLQFEHRDLHWGNVLVRPTDTENIKYRLKGKPVSVPSQGVEASVIDFTMSRLTKGKLLKTLSNFLHD